MKVYIVYEKLFDINPYILKLLKNFRGIMSKL